MYWSISSCAGIAESSNMVSLSKTRRRYIVLWGLVGFALPVVWGIIGFLTFTAPQSIWEDIFWYTVNITCPPWVLPETSLSWLLTPLFNGLIYAAAALVVVALRQSRSPGQ